MSSTTGDFYAHPILNSPYEHPARHWELDKDGQPTQAILERRRPAAYITPIPKPKKRKGTKAGGRMAWPQELINHLGDEVMEVFRAGQVEA